MGPGRLWVPFPRAFLDPLTIDAPAASSLHSRRLRAGGCLTSFGNTNAWQTGGAAVWVTGTYDPDTNQTIWGTGNPVPMFDPTYRPGDNLYTNSAISWDPDTGKMNWFFQFTPGDMWDYDEVGTHILIDGEVAGQPRKLITHSARNGFLYTMDRHNGQIIGAGTPAMAHMIRTRNRALCIALDRPGTKL